MCLDFGCVEWAFCARAGIWLSELVTLKCLKHWIKGYFTHNHKQSIFCQSLRTVLYTRSSVFSPARFFFIFTVWALSAISSIIYLIVQSKSKLMCMTVSVSRWAFTDPPTQLPELMAQLTLLGAQWDLMALALTIELILTSRSCWRTDEPYCLQPNMHKSITNAL